MAHSHDKPDCEGRGPEEASNRNWAGVRGKFPQTPVCVDELLDFGKNGIDTILQNFRATREVDQVYKSGMEIKFANLAKSYCERRILAALFDADKVDMADYGRSTQELRTAMESTINPNHLESTMQAIDARVDELLKDAPSRPAARFV
ncbi:MAG: hypothetical protein SFX19_04705 [Alphaproteobacteria bacterium]|nr:hypothetical protein [Alphaproteobacteria bacterium]